MTGREAAGVRCNSEIVLIWALWHAVIPLKAVYPILPGTEELKF